MGDRSGICGNPNRVEPILIFHLKNFASFTWRWWAIMLVAYILCKFTEVSFAQSPGGATSYILFTSFAAWVWAWKPIIKRWRNRVFEEAIDVKFEDIDAP